MNYFWKSKFWIFPDSHNFASATPKMRDRGDGGRNFCDLIGNSKSQFSMRITNSTILSRSGPRMAEISTISSKIRNLNFRWESRIRQFREVDGQRRSYVLIIPTRVDVPKGQRRSYVLIIPTLVDVPKGRHRIILSKFSFRMWTIFYHNLKEKTQFKVTYGDICICHLKWKKSI